MAQRLSDMPNYNYHHCDKMFTKPPSNEYDSIGFDKFRSDRKPNDGRNYSSESFSRRVSQTTFGKKAWLLFSAPKASESRLAEAHEF